MQARKPLPKPPKPKPGTCRIIDLAAYKDEYLAQLEAKRQQARKDKSNGDNTKVRHDPRQAQD